MLIAHTFECCSYANRQTARRNRNSDETKYTFFDNLVGHPKATTAEWVVLCGSAIRYEIEPDAQAGVTGFTPVRIR